MLLTLPLALPQVDKFQEMNLIKAVTFCFIKTSDKLIRRKQ